MPEETFMYWFKKNLDIETYLPDTYKHALGLIALSTISKGKVLIKCGGKTYYPNLYIMMVGESGSGKSYAINDVLRNVIKEIDESLLLASDFTPEGMKAILKESEPRGLIWNAELRTVANTKKYMSDMSGVLADLYDCTERIVRRAKEKYYLKSSYINLILGVQPETLYNIVDREVMEVGLLQRFIIVHGSRMKRHSAKYDFVSRSQYMCRLTAFNAFINKIKHPLYIYVSDELWNKIIDYSEKIVKTVPPFIEESFNRFDETVFKITGLMALDRIIEQIVNEDISIFDIPDEYILLSDDASNIPDTMINTLLGIKFDIYKRFIDIMKGTTPEIFKNRSLGECFNFMIDYKNLVDIDGENVRADVVDSVDKDVVYRMIAGNWTTRGKEPVKTLQTQLNNFIATGRSRMFIENQVLSGLINDMKIKIAREGDGKHATKNENNPDGNEGGSDGKALYTSDGATLAHNVLATLDVNQKKGEQLTSTATVARDTLDTSDKQNPSGTSIVDRIRMARAPYDRGPLSKGAPYNRVVGNYTYLDSKGGCMRGYTPRILYRGGVFLCFFVSPDIDNKKITSNANFSSGTPPPTPLYKALPADRPSNDTLAHQKNERQQGYIYFSDGKNHLDEDVACLPTLANTSKNGKIPPTPPLYYNNNGKSTNAQTTATPISLDDYYIKMLLLNCSTLDSDYNIAVEYISKILKGMTMVATGVTGTDVAKAFNSTAKTIFRLLERGEYITDEGRVLVRFRDVMMNSRIPEGLKRSWNTYDYIIMLLYDAGILKSMDRIRKGNTKYLDVNAGMVISLYGAGGGEKDEDEQQ